MNMKRLFSPVKIYSGIACFHKRTLATWTRVGIFSFVSHESLYAHPRAMPGEETGARFYVARGAPCIVFRHTSPSSFYYALFVPLFPKARTALASFRAQKATRGYKRAGQFFRFLMASCGGLRSRAMGAADIGAESPPRRSPRFCLRGEEKHANYGRAVVAHRRQ